MAAFKSLLALVALLLAVGAGEHTEPRGARAAAPACAASGPGCLCCQPLLTPIPR